MRHHTMAVEDTLSRSLRPATVGFGRLMAEHGPMLQLVRLIIGVVPNCDPVLAIWPPGFRTYNLLVPNLLNLPFSVWGFGPPAITLGLALCAASRTAQCAYCTAHTCSFTLRRGSNPEKLAGDLTPAESAAVRMAEALASIPCTVTAEHRAELLRHFSAMDAERLVLGIAVMGFLNKFMDAIGVDLEAAAVEEVSQVLHPLGWAPGKHRVDGTWHDHPDLQARPAGRDTLSTKLAILRHLPAAIRIDRGWTRGVPARWPAVGTYLQEHTGHDFPVLANLRSRRAVRAVATVLRDNLAAADSHLGLRTKALAGFVYASRVGSDMLTRAARALMAQAAPPLAERTLDAIARFAVEPADLADLADLNDLENLEDEALLAAQARLEALPGLDGETALALLLARAVSPSPAAVPAPLIARVAASLSPEAQVELVVWVAVQQMLHRLGSFVNG